MYSIDFQIQIFHSLMPAPCGASVLSEVAERTRRSRSRRQVVRAIMKSMNLSSLKMIDSDLHLV